MLHRCFMYEYMQKRLRETQKIPVKSRSTVQQRKKKIKMRMKGNKANFKPLMKHRVKRELTKISSGSKAPTEV